MVPNFRQQSDRALQRLFRVPPLAFHEGVEEQVAPIGAGGEDDPDRYVKLVFVLAAVDGEAHLKALMQLSKILDDEGKVDKLVEIDDVDGLYDQINKFIEGEE